MAAYRFLGNDEIEWTDVMQPHWERTAARAGQFPMVLCIADTTELNFNGQEKEGLVPLSFEAQRGMYLHPTYAVTPAREPLGVIDAWMWAREPRDGNGQRGGIKESIRDPQAWTQLAQASPRSQRLRQGDARQARQHGDRQRAQATPPSTRRSRIRRRRGAVR